VGVEEIGSFNHINFSYFTSKTIILAFNKDKAGLQESLNLAKRSKRI